MGVKTLQVSNNDFVLSGGRLVMLDGIDALRQLTENRLKLWLGEWFLAPNAGIDWLGLMNQKTFLEKRLTVAIRNQVLSDTRIKKITSLSVSLDRGTREISVELSLLADEGAFEVSI